MRLPILPTTLAAGLVLTIVLGVTIYRWVKSRQKEPFPPGPRGWPIIGNLLDVPKTQPWKKFADWGKQYGPISYIKVINQPIVVLNSQVAALALLRDRAAIYSDRQRFVMCGELCDQGWATPLLKYGPWLKEHLRVLAQVLQPRMLEQAFVPVQERLVRECIAKIVEKPQDFMDVVDRSAGEIIQTVGYGAIQDGDVDFVKYGADNFKIFLQTIQGYSVDLLPWLRYLPSWLPGMKFKRDAKKWTQVARGARYLPFNFVKRQRAAGTITQASLVSMLLDDADTPGQDPDREDLTISAVVATLFGGAAETIAGSFLGFMLAMVLNPEAQAKARAEVDRVLTDRLPTAADKESLPYLNAVLLETLRWFPAIPAGVAHMVTQDDSYDGYLIPAGTIVIPNVWGIFQDEAQYPNPSQFIPERWLSPPAKAGEQQVFGVPTGVPDPRAVLFGYGRRTCPAIDVALMELWIFMSTFLCTFDIQAKIDPETRKPIVPKVDSTGGLIVKPLPFECDIKPRSSEHSERIRRAVAEGKKTHPVSRYVIAK